MCSCTMASKKYLIITILSIAVLCGKLVNGANILALLGMPSPSHHIWNSVLINELGNRGHNVTVLSADIPKNPSSIPKNVYYIHLDDLYSNLYDNSDEPLNLTDFIDHGIFESITMFYDICYKITEAALRSRNNEILLNYPDNFKFDLVIIDYSCGGFLLHYLHKFNYPPLVGISPFLNPPATLDFAGGHRYPAYAPYFSLPYHVKMNFIERTISNVIFIADLLYRRYFITPKLDKLVRNYTKMNIPYLGDLEKRTAIALVNSHPATNVPEPLPPNVIEVGGLQIVDPKPLPKEMDDFINKSKKGGVFFSLGTNVKSEYLGRERIQIILDAMAQLPDYHFLWKSDVNVKDYKIPKNVFVQIFFPQRDILANPKIKVFVTHSGGLSTHEAIWRGVPMVGLPLFADQLGNLYKAMKMGVAEKVSYLNFTVENLRDQIKKVAEDPSYLKNIRIHSARYRDRPMKPLDTAVWWVEYVLRNSNPEHLRSPVHELGLIVANSLDLIFIVFVILTVLAFSLLCLCINCFCTKDKNVKRKGVKIDKKLKSN